MANIAIIPARGGSKRIPRKNIREFKGIPIIAYSIRVAIDSNIFDNILVSTDDHEIAEIALKYGAKVPFIRESHLSDDFASTFSVLEDAIKRLRVLDQNFENGCCIYPCAPLITKEHLIQGYNTFKSHQYFTVFPVLEYSFPIWRSLRLGGNGKTNMVWPEFQNSRSQDLEKIYHDAGQWYFFDVLKLLEEKKLYTSNSGSVIIDPMDAQDIDNEQDWVLAELKYDLRCRKEKL